jgi:hypothetical protein
METGGAHKPYAPYFRGQALAGVEQLRCEHEAAGSDDFFWRRLLLHLPRLGPHEGASATIVSDEALRISEQVRQSVGMDMQRAGAPIQAREASFGMVPDEIAFEVHTRFHYLQSRRIDSVHLGLFRSPLASLGTLLAIATFSRLDVASIIETLGSGLGASDVWVLSRLFAFADAPENALSFLISRCVHRFRQARPRPRLILSYLDPNVGYSGSTYRAAGAYLYATEAHAPFFYLDRDFITTRALVSRCGAARPSELASTLGGRFQCSTTPLLPLEIYAVAVDRRLSRSPCFEFGMNQLVNEGANAAAVHPTP